MRRFAPLLFPIAAVLIVLLLLYRWYSMRTDQVADPVEFGEGVEIENLSEDELIQGTGDYESVQLEPPAQTEDQASESADPQVPVSGEIRYQIDGDRVRFSVIAQLPEMESGSYEVWLRGLDGQGARRAFALDSMKGGFSGSAELPTTLLSFEVVVTQQAAEGIGPVLLRGVIEAPASPSPSADGDMASPTASPEAEQTGQ